MGSDWQLSLEQNRDLEVTHGSSAATAETLSRGADLRVFLDAESYEETLYFQQTYVGENDAFAGMMTHHHSHSHRGTLVDQPYFSFFKYDTSGAFSQVKWMLDNVTFDESQRYQYGVYRWFTCDRWRVVYENDADGNCVAGDLDELMHCVRHGQTVKVGVRQLYGIQNDDPGGPAHISFLSVMQPLIENDHVGANCDFVLTGAPQWPFTWRDDLRVGMLWPWTSGRIVCHLVRPGHLPFRRTEVHRGMQWLVADEG
ncbi:MAG: hypothetical protein MK110_17520 [Fuerstiella sp.]|nr:hypothetical protein [Fuerstiella sp.]